MGILMQIIKSVSSESVYMEKPLALIIFKSDEELPNALSGNNSNKSSAESENKVIPAKIHRLKCREVRRNHGVGRWKNIKYVFRNTFFGDRDIISTIEEKYNLNRADGIDAYKEAARKYFQSILGDTTNLSKEEIKKRYEKIEQEFALQITHMTENNEFVNGVLAAVLSELEANKRALAAEEFISLGVSNKDINLKARALQKDAETNLTKADAFGKAPDKEVALEYQNTTFGNMDEIGIKEALAKISEQAESIKYDIEECKKLCAKNRDELTPDELEKVVFYENLVLAGYAGGYTGIASNQFISESFAAGCMTNIYSDTEKYNISNEVIDLANEYINKKPEIDEVINDLRGKSFSCMISETEEEYKNNPEFSAKSGINAAHETNKNENKSKETQNDFAKSQDKSKERYEEPDTGKLSKIETPARESSVINGTVQNETSYKGSHQTQTSAGSYSTQSDADMSSAYTSNKKTDISPVTKPGNTSAKTTDHNISLDEAVKGSIEKFKQYQKDNHISKLKACKIVLNNRDADISLKKQKRDEYKALNTSDKELVFDTLNTTAQIFTLNVMDSTEIKKMEFRSSYSKEYADKLCEKKNEL